MIRVVKMLELKINYLISKKLNHSWLLRTIEEKDER